MVERMERPRYCSLRSRDEVGGALGRAGRRADRLPPSVVQRAHALGGRTRRPRAAACARSRASPSRRRPRPRGCARRPRARASARRRSRSPRPPARLGARHARAAPGSGRGARDLPAQVADDAVVRVARGHHERRRADWPRNRRVARLALDEARQSRARLPAAARHSKTGAQSRELLARAVGPRITARAVRTNHRPQVRVRQLAERRGLAPAEPSARGRVGREREKRRPHRARQSTWAVSFKIKQERESARGSGSTGVPIEVAVVRVGGEGRRSTTRTSPRRRTRRCRADAVRDAREVARTRPRRRGRRAPRAAPSCRTGSRSSRRRASRRGGRAGSCERAVEDGRAPLCLERDPVDVVGHCLRRRADVGPRAAAAARRRGARARSPPPRGGTSRARATSRTSTSARPRGARPRACRSSTGAPPDVRRDRADRRAWSATRGRDRRRVRQADRLRHREVVHPHPARPRRLGERGVHRVVVVIDRRGDRLRAVVAAHGSRARRQRREVRGPQARDERRPVVRVFEERAARRSTTAERLHRREVVTAWVRLGAASHWCDTKLTFARAWSSPSRSSGTTKPSSSTRLQRPPAPSREEI